jgi:hypothetical protein
VWGRKTLATTTKGKKNDLFIFSNARKNMYSTVQQYASISRDQRKKTYEGNTEERFEENKSEEEVRCTKLCSTAVGEEANAEERYTDQK